MIISFLSEPYVVNTDYVLVYEQNQKYRLSITDLCRRKLRL